MAAIRGAVRLSIKNGQIISLIHMALYYVPHVDFNHDDTYSRGNVAINTGDKVRALVCTEALFYIRPHSNLS